MTPYCLPPTLLHATTTTLTCHYCGNNCLLCSTITTYLTLLVGNLLNHVPEEGSGPYGSTGHKFDLPISCPTDSCSTHPGSVSMPLQSYHPSPPPPDPALVGQGSMGKIKLTQHNITGEKVHASHVIYYNVLKRLQLAIKFVPQV